MLKNVDLLEPVNDYSCKYNTEQEMESNAIFLWSS